MARFREPDKWQVGVQLCAHSMEHCLKGRFYRWRRCEDCGEPIGVWLHSCFDPKYRDECTCDVGAARRLTIGNKMLWGEVAEVIMRTPAAIDAFLAYDLDILDLEEGCETNRADARLEHAAQRQDV